MNRVILNKDIPFFSYAQAPQGLKSEWMRAIQDVVESGNFISGHYVKKFEEEWTLAIGSKYSIGVSNGLDGLVLALTALGIGEGDLVAVPAHTFFATWIAVLRTGATPMGIDVDANGLLDLEILFSLKMKIKAVIPVHMHGAMVNMLKLCSWAKSQGVFVVEDASQSHLAKIDERSSGNWGEVGVFSLYPSKNLGALGDAGVVVTSDEKIAMTIRKLANYGSDVKNKYKHQLIGYNNRLDSIQAAILSVNLKYLKEWNNTRVDLAAKYLGLFEGNQIQILHNAEINSVRHHFCILHENRDRLMQELRKDGIGSEIHYPFTAASEYQNIMKLDKIDFPNATKLSKQILSIPLSQWHSVEQVQKVAHSVISIVERL